MRADQKSVSVKVRFPWCLTAGVSVPVGGSCTHMPKRKLDAQGDPAELCRGLADQRGVSFRLARRLVAALHPSGRGQRVLAR